MRESVRGGLRKAKAVWRVLEIFDTVAGYWNLLPQWARAAAMALILSLVPGTPLAILLASAGVIEQNWLSFLVFAVGIGSISWTLLSIGSKAVRQERRIYVAEHGSSREAVVADVEQEHTKMKEGNPMPRSESDLGGDAVDLGRGTYHDVIWRGWRMPNRWVDADGPFCPADEAALMYKSDGPAPSPAKDYQEVRPPETYLVCPQCSREFFLTATDKKTQRIGDSRRYAAWRLAGGKTRLERIFDNLGF